jgi:RimJ/RimL family protein N-acetyltransferase
LFAVAADPLIWEQHPARDRYQPEVFRAFFDEAVASGGALIATDSRDGQVIGCSRYHGHSAEQSEIEIGWTFLARAYWGRERLSFEITAAIFDRTCKETVR